MTQNKKTTRVTIFGTAAAAALLAGTGAALASDEPPVSGITGTGVENIVTATGSYGPSNTPVSNQGYEQVTVATAAPGISVTKTVANTGSGTGGAFITGDQIEFTVTVENTGNVNLFEVTLTDDFSDVAGTLTGPNLDASQPGITAASTDDTADNDFDKLAPGETITYTATYTVTDADMTSEADDGAITNDVSVAAEDYAGNADYATDTDSVDASLDIDPSLDITKTASKTTGAVAGDVITYTYTVTNDGTVPISSIALTDAHTSATGTSALTVTCNTLTDNAPIGGSTFTSGSNAITLLAPNDVVTCTASYTVTQQDVDELQ